MNNTPSFANTIEIAEVPLPQNQVNILIVDDKPDNLRLLSKILNNRGYEVRKALNGHMALMSIEAIAPDLILLDINMPGMDGYQLCQKLKTNEKTRDVPVIFISALDDVLDQVKGFAVGGVDYITKPFHGEEVVARVENHLTLRSLQKQLQEQNARLQQEIRDRISAETALRETESRLRQQNQVLVKLSRNKALYRGNLNAALKEITEVAAQTLDIERASVWLYNQSGEAIQCLDLFERSISQHSQGMELSEIDYPDYFEALEADWTIAAHDAHHDPRTREFTDSYLVPLGIQSMLDVPIRLGGHTVGVLCLEHVGSLRHWTLEEQKFAGSLADLASLAVEACARKRLQKEVLQQRRFLNSIIEHIPLAVYVQDVVHDFRFVLWNKGSEQIFEKSREAAIGRTVDDLYPKPQADFFREKDFEVLQTGQLVEIPEEPFDTKAGEIRWLRTLKVPVIDDRDRITHLLCIAEDITERKQAQEALEQAEEKYRSIFENATEGIFQMAPNGCYISANLALARMYGYDSPEELIASVTHVGKQLYLRPNRWAIFVGMLEQNAVLSNFEAEVYRKDGNVIWISQNVRVVCDVRGRICYYEGIVTDITRRKFAEDALRESERQLRNYNKVLVKLTKNKGIGQGNLSVALKAITKATARMLGLGRVSVWLYDESRSKIECLNLFDLDANRYSEGMELAIEDYPSYFKALQSKGSVVSSDVLSDPRLQELLDSYLIPPNIRSLLDVPVSQSGKILGVVCLEQVNKEHHWTPEEESFARSIAELVALALEARDRKRAEEALRLEQEKSEQLLLNILPHAIAKRLKEEQRAIAEHFNEVTILFADIVGFTPLSAKLPPIALVNFLNEIFSTFDELAEKHGLEKIKTIGDAYMVVGGLPVARADHAEAVAAMALDMQAAIQHFQAEKGEPFQIRIGINTGPVVAGVIGIKKFIYDLWGDTVNVASRMESSGLPGNIQVTTAIYERLKDKYIFEERGAIAVKGKGNMNTYWLQAPKLTL